jgi:hypothetical protein
MAAIARARWSKQPDGSLKRGHTTITITKEEPNSYSYRVLYVKPGTRVSITIGGIPTGTSARRQAFSMADVIEKP